MCKEARVGYEIVESKHTPGIIFVRLIPGERTIDFIRVYPQYAEKVGVTSQLQQLLECSQCPLFLQDPWWSGESTNIYPEYGYRTEGAFPSLQIICEGFAFRAKEGMRKYTGDENQLPPCRNKFKNPVVVVYERSD